MNNIADKDVRENITNLIMNWYKANCSQETEDDAWTAIQDNETLVMEYIKTWKVSQSIGRSVS